MEAKQTRKWYLVFFTLAPVPVAGVLVLLALMFGIMNSQEISIGGRDSGRVQVADAPPILSEQAAALATIQAAPFRPAPPPVAADVSGEEAIEIAAAAGYEQSLIDAGQRNYLAVCSACHGVDARGISGLGKTLIDSEFMHQRTDAELLAFTIEGRAIWDPANTTGVAMPARGGNPGLTDNDILSIIAYLRVADGFIPGGAEAAAASAVEPVEVAPEPAAETSSSEPAEVVEVVETERVTFEYIDVSAFLASLGVSLPDPLPQPERDGATLYEDVCGRRYGVEYVAQADFCSYIEAQAIGGANAAHLFELIRVGDPIWINESGAGVHIPKRAGYPPLWNAEIGLLITYIYEVNGLPAPLEGQMPIENTTDVDGEAALRYAVTNISGFVARVGMDSESEALPQAERDGERIFNDLCGQRYGVGTVQQADFCDYFLAQAAEGVAAEELETLLQTGQAVWNNPEGIQIPSRGGYPPLTDEEISLFIEHVFSLASNADANSNGGE